MPISIYAAVSGENNRDRISISDVLFDENDSPITNAAVTLLRNGNYINRQVFTNAQGEFTVEDLPYGEYTVEARSYTNPSIVNRLYPPIDSSTALDFTTGIVDNCLLPATLPYAVRPAVRNISEDIYASRDQYDSVTLYLLENWNRGYNLVGDIIPLPVGITWGVINSLAPGGTAYANISLQYPGGPATPDTVAWPASVLLVDPFDYYRHTDNKFYHYGTGAPAPDSMYLSPGVPIQGIHFPYGYWYDTVSNKWAYSNELPIYSIPYVGQRDIFSSTFGFVGGLSSEIRAQFGTDNPGIQITASTYKSVGLGSPPTVTTISPERCLSPEFILDTNNLISQTELDSGISTLKTLYDPHLFSGGKETEANSALAYTPEIEENIKNLCSILEIETPAKGNISASNINALLVQFLIKPRLEQLKAHFSITQEEAYESLKRESVFPGNKLLSAYDRSYLSSSSLVAGVIASGLDKEYNLPPVGTKLYGVFSQINIVEGPEAKLVSNSTITEDSPEKLAHELLDTLGTSAFDDKLALWVNKIEHHIRR